MKPLVVDTSLWVDWFRGKDRLRGITSGRVLYLPSVIVMELYSGARDAKSLRSLDAFVAPFVAHRRIVVPNEKDFITAGKILGELKWPATKYSNDALIVTCARRIGAEVASLNERDFAPLCRRLSVTLMKL